MSDYRQIDGLRTISGSFDRFLIDQFGVLHDGVRPYDGAIDCLMNLKAHGKCVVLISNSGKRAIENSARLVQFGFPRGSFDDVVTSGEVAWQGIASLEFGVPFVPGNRMFLVGHDDHDYGFEKLGIVRVENPATADFIMIAASSAPKMSLGQYGELLSGGAAAGIPALCCNPDRLMLTSAGPQPSAGEIAWLYRQAGGEVTFVGKPYPAIYAAAARQSPAFPPARTVAIGDSVEHDIAGGNGAGMATALVRTGLSARPGDDWLKREIQKCGAVLDFVLPGLRW